MPWVTELLTLTVDWHYTMAWFPASLLKHTGAYLHARRRYAYGSFMKGDNDGEN